MNYIFVFDEWICIAYPLNIKYKHTFVTCSIESIVSFINGFLT